MFTFSFIVLGYEVWKLVLAVPESDGRPRGLRVGWLAGRIGGRVSRCLKVPRPEYVDSPPELDIARDLVRRGLPAAPALVLVSALIWGVRRRAVERLRGRPRLAELRARGHAAGVGGADLAHDAHGRRHSGGFVVRMGLIVRRRAARQGRRWVSLPRSASRSSSPTSACCCGRPSTCPPRWPIPALKPVSGKELTGDPCSLSSSRRSSHLVEWPDFFGDGPFAVNKVVLQMWISVVIVRRVLLRGRSAAPPRPQGGPEPGRVGRSTSSTTTSSCRRWARMGCGYCRSCSRSSASSSSATSGRSSLGCQMPVNARIAIPALLAILVWFIFNIVGITKQGSLRLLQVDAVPARRAVAALHPRRADRVRLGALRPAALAVGPALRQHARRPPPARDLRRDHAPRCGRSASPSCSSRSRSACSSP